MSRLKGTLLYRSLLHLGLTALGALLALWVWTDEEDTSARVASEVRVYPGSREKLESIRFESESAKMRLEPREDERGSYYVVRLEEEKRQRRSPHAQLDEKEPNEKGPDEKGDASDDEPSKKEAKTEIEKSSFISVTEGDKLAEGFAPLMAMRAIGRIEKDRAEEFGFDEPKGTIIVKLGGQEHRLQIGGNTPGGGDRYLRLSATKEAYAVKGDLVRGLMHASSQLLERDFHAFDSDEATRVVLGKGNRQRELLRLKGKAEGWASPSAPEELDETASNWMSKLGRLRVRRYLEKGPTKVAEKDKVVRVEYFDGRSPLGHLTLVRSKSDSGDPMYLARSEQTRWYVEVLKSTAEQIDQDLGSVLEPAK